MSWKSELSSETKIYMHWINESRLINPSLGDIANQCPVLPCFLKNYVIKVCEVKSVCVIKYKCNGMMSYLQFHNLKLISLRLKLQYFFQRLIF